MRLTMTSGRHVTYLSEVALYEDDTETLSRKGGRLAVTSALVKQLPTGRSAGKHLVWGNSDKSTQALDVLAMSCVFPSGEIVLASEDEDVAFEFLDTPRVTSLVAGLDELRAEFTRELDSVFISLNNPITAELQSQIAMILAKGAKDGAVVAVTYKEGRQPSEQLVDAVTGKGRKRLDEAVDFLNPVTPEDALLGLTYAVELNRELYLVGCSLLPTEACWFWDRGITYTSVIGKIGRKTPGTSLRAFLQKQDVGKLPEELTVIEGIPLDIIRTLCEGHPEAIRNTAAVCGIPEESLRDALDREGVK